MWRISSIDYFFTLHVSFICKMEHKMEHLIRNKWFCVFFFFLRPFISISTFFNAQTSRWYPVICNVFVIWNSLLLILYYYYIFVRNNCCVDYHLFLLFQYPDKPSRQQKKDVKELVWLFSTSKIWHLFCIMFAMNTERFDSTNYFFLDHICQLILFPYPIV